MEQSDAGVLQAAANGSDVAKMRVLNDGNINHLWASPDSAVGTGTVWVLPL